MMSAEFWTRRGHLSVFFLDDQQKLIGLIESLHFFQINKMDRREWVKTKNNHSNNNENKIKKRISLKPGQSFIGDLSSDMLLLYI
jgi:hypothetical protein